MRCGCLKDIEVKLTNHFKAEAGDDVKVECQNVGLVIPDKGPMQQQLLSGLLHQG